MVGWLVSCSVLQLGGWVVGQLVHVGQPLRVHDHEPRGCGRWLVGWLFVRLGSWAVGQLAHVNSHSVPAVGVVLEFSRCQAFEDTIAVATAQQYKLSTLLYSPVVSVGEEDKLRIGTPFSIPLHSMADIG